MSRLLVDTPLFRVEQRVFSRPGEEPVTRDVVVHPGAVVILAILERQSLVMIRNYRYAVERELWELPAGTLEQNEEPIDTARRELEEETGYRAGRMDLLTKFYTSPGVLTERMHAFVARELTHVGQKLREAERIVVEVLPVETVRRMLLCGDLQDGKTIAVLGRYFLGSTS